MDALLRAGRYDEVLADAQALVRAAPLRERRWSLLALAQYQSGAQGEALRTIHQLKAVLARQLGIDAGPDVMALEQAILRQDASLLSGPALAPSTSTCPWQGLKPYAEGDADRFFGREGDVGACLEILRADVAAGSRRPVRFGEVVTPARRGRGHPEEARSPHDLDHAGQPSDAGDLRVRRRRTCRDGAAGRPVRGAVLPLRRRRGAAGVHRRPDRRRRHGHRASWRCVPTIWRTSPPAPPFSRLVERGLYLVGGLEDAGLREAIEGPARQAGLVIEPGLVDVLVREVEGRSRRVAAALARPAGDLEAPGGQHPDRGRLPRLRRHPRRRRAVRRAPLRAGRRRAAAGAA